MRVPLDVRAWSSCDLMLPSSRGVLGMEQGGRAGSEDKGERQEERRASRSIRGQVCERKESPERE